MTQNIEHPVGAAVMRLRFLFISDQITKPQFMRYMAALVRTTQAISLLDLDKIELQVAIGLQRSGFYEEAAKLFRIVASKHAGSSMLNIEARLRRAETLQQWAMSLPADKRQQKLQLLDRAERIAKNALGGLNIWHSLYGEAQQLLELINHSIDGSALNPSSEPALVGG